MMRFTCCYTIYVDVCVLCIRLEAETNGGQSHCRHALGKKAFFGSGVTSFHRPSILSGLVVSLFLYQIDFFPSSFADQVCSLCARFESSGLNKEERGIFDRVITKQNCEFSAARECP